MEYWSYIGPTMFSRCTVRILHRKCHSTLHRTATDVFVTYRWIPQLVALGRVYDTLDDTQREMIRARHLTPNILHRWYDLYIALVSLLGHVVAIIHLCA
jgi:hypothetical protein